MSVSTDDTVSTSAIFRPHVNNGYVYLRSRPYPNTVTDRRLRPVGQDGGKTENKTGGHFMDFFT